MFLGLLDRDPDPFVRGTGYGSGSGSFPFLINVLSGLKYVMPAKLNFSKQFEFFSLKMMCL
jgi:hypothetical protein